MSYRVRCKCGAGFVVPATLAGHTVRCRECGGSLRVARSASRVHSEESTSPQKSPGNISYWPIISRLIGALLGLLTAWLIYARISALDDTEGITMHDSRQLLIALMIFVAGGIPAWYLLFYGIQFGPTAAAARSKGVTALFLGLGMAFVGFIGMCVLAYLAMSFGVILIQWGLLLPLALAIAGIIKIITGVDIVATLEEKDDTPKESEEHHVGEFLSNLDIPNDRDS